METINNVVQKATTAIWGEDDTSHQLQSVETHGDEPMSGVQGKGAVNDPFDAGNREGELSEPRSRHLDIKVRRRFLPVYDETLALQGQATWCSLSSMTGGRETECITADLIPAIPSQTLSYPFHYIIYDRT